MSCKDDFLNLNAAQLKAEFERHRNAPEPGLNKRGRMRIGT